MQDSDVLSVSQSVLQMQLHAGPGQGVRTPAGLLLAATAHQHHQLRNIQQPSPSTSPTPTSTPTPSPSPTSILTPRPKATPTPAPPSTSFFVRCPRSRWFGNIYDMWYLKERTTKNISHNPAVRFWSLHNEPDLKSNAFKSFKRFSVYTNSWVADCEVSICCILFENHWNLWSFSI